MIVGDVSWGSVRLVGSDVCPLLEIAEDLVQNGHECNAGRRASALSTAIGTDKFGALSRTWNNDGLNNLPDEIWFDAVDDSEVFVTIQSDSFDERKPMYDGSRTANKSQPSSEIAETGGLDDARLANA